MYFNIGIYGAQLTMLRYDVLVTLFCTENSLQMHAELGKHNFRSVMSSPDRVFAHVLLESP